jgi:hypothetical protein
LPGIHGSAALAERGHLPQVLKRQRAFSGEVQPLALSPEAQSPTVHAQDRNHF